MQCILLEKFNQKFTDGNTTAEDSNQNSTTTTTKNDDAIETTNNDSILKVNVGRKLVKKSEKSANSPLLFAEYVRKALQKLCLNNDMVGIYFFILIKVNQKNLVFL